MYRYIYIYTYYMCVCVSCQRNLFSRGLCNVRWCFQSHRIIHVYIPLSLTLFLSFSLYFQLSARVHIKTTPWRSFNSRENTARWCVRPVVATAAQWWQGVRRLPAVENREANAKYWQSMCLERRATSVVQVSFRTSVSHIKCHASRINYERIDKLLLYQWATSFKFTHNDV